MVQSEMRKQEDETKKSKAVSLSTQGNWMGDGDVRGKNLTWNEMWTMETYRLKFAIASVYDLLPSPSNLGILKLREEPQ